MYLTEKSHERTIRIYQKNDYVVVPDALSPNEVRTINEIIDRDLVENPAMWFERGGWTLPTQCPSADYTPGN